MKFERTPATPGSHGRYEYQTGVVTIRQEATTHAYPRGASNPRWFVYFDGERRRGSFATLAEAKQNVMLGWSS